MASGVRSDLSLKEWKLLAFASGNRCAFPKCDRFLSIPSESDEDGVVLGAAAHIVAASRQGPRGDVEISDEDRDKSARNRILLCPEHHKLIDERPRTYTPQVLATMKRNHERKHTQPDARAGKPVLVTETLRSSLLPITAVPSFVMSLPLKKHGTSEGAIATQVRWPKDRQILVPFIVRDNRLYTFANLTSDGHPFDAVVMHEKPEVLDARELWTDPEGHRRYVALLNKCLTKHLGQRGLRFDREHRRYWFTAEPGPSPKTISYRSKQGHHQSRQVVRQRVRKSTGEAKEWWHVAAGLRFERVSAESWVLSIRPEYQITSDGSTPLPPKTHSAKSARRKSKIYNEGFLNLLHFWLEFLMADQPRLILQALDERIVIDGNLSTCSVSWPGVKDDQRTYLARDIAENLFTSFELAESEEPIQIDDAWWHEDGEEDAL